MKKVFYIFFVVGLIISLQSCDRVSNMLGDRNETRQEQPSEGEVSLDTGVSVSHGDSARTVELQVRLKQKDCVINALTDSLSIVAENVASLQTDLQNLKKEQEELQNEKVGVKNLFVFLVISFIVIVVFIIFFVRKLVKKFCLNEDKVKGIIEYMSKKHPEIVCSGLYSTVTQCVNAINGNQRTMSELKNQVSCIINKMGATDVVGNAENRRGQQSWETQATAIPQDKGALESKNNVFYMKRPIENLEFDLSLKSLNPTEETLYRFELDARHPSLAKFYFDCNSASRVRWALSTKDKTLDRVCNATGNSTNGRYTCTSPGEAKFQDGKWIVTRKAVVIFD